MAKRSKKKKGVDREISGNAFGAGSIGSQESKSGRDWLWGLVLLLSVVLVYSPVWWAGYVWDDNLVVATNPVVVGPLGLKAIWTTSAADICPLTLTTFWFEHALWGSAALPYHLVNVFLHALCAIVLWRVLRSLQVPAAWLGAALWALHPVMVESVAWITEMKNTESALFFLLAALFFVKDLRAGRVNDQQTWSLNYILTLVFSALAMASKSSTVILPLTLCLCAWWMEGRWRWRQLAKVVPIFLMSLIAALVSIWTQRIGGADDPLWVRAWPERLADAGQAVWFYLGKLLWPHPLAFIYPGWETGAGMTLSYLPLAAVVGLWIILWLKRETWLRSYFFAYSYFLVALLPVLGLVQLYFARYAYVADHFQYLASMGPLALAGAGMVRLTDLIIPGRRELRCVLGAAILLLFAALSWNRTWVYENDKTLWTDTLAKNPNCWLAHNNLALILLQEGRWDEAIAHCQAALQLNPNFAEADNNLGIALFQKGDLDQAIALCRKALEIRPNYAEAHNSLGNYLQRKGDLNDAIAHYQRALEIKPNYAEALNNLGVAFFNLGEWDQAIEVLQRFMKIDPNAATGHNSLGVALFQKGRIAEAIEQFQEALLLKPGDEDVQNNLSKAQAVLQKSSSLK
jgi:tetratricopeptide (TPR) repeat protein